MTIRFKLELDGLTTDQNLAKEWLVIQLINRKREENPIFAMAHKESPAYLEAQQEAEIEAEDKIALAEYMWREKDNIAIGMFRGELKEVPI